MRLLLFFRKKYPNAFSIERLFDQLAEAMQAKSVHVTKSELPWYNNTLGQVLKNIRWARARVQEIEEKSSGRRAPARLIKHVTGDVTSIIFGFSGPTVITIHDCNPLLRYPSSHPRYWFYRWVIFEWPARRAEAVTVISEKTRDELARLTNCPTGKIHVIPNFVDPQFVPQPKPFNSDKPVILQVGVKKNKNLTGLAQALKGIPCTLDIIGEPSAEDAATLADNQIDYRWSSRISDEELRGKYAACDMLSFVSTYEGFGLPILEAQVIGRPIVTSDLSPHREVAGQGGAILVDPHDPASIRSGILRVIERKDVRERLVALGNENVARYHIDHIAREYIELYKSILVA